MYKHVQENIKDNQEKISNVTDWNCWHPFFRP